MADLYQLTLEPTILREEFPGELGYVTYSARSLLDAGAKPIKTFIENQGDFHTRFSIFEDEDANALVAAMQLGYPVALAKPVTREVLLKLGFRSENLI